MLRTFFATALGAIVALAGIEVPAASAFPVQINPGLQTSSTSPLIQARAGGGGGHIGGGGGGFNRPSTLPAHRPSYKPGYKPNYKPNYNHNYRHWNKYYYGPRCNSWTSYCRYNYGGYWYANPWWLPVVGAGIAVTSNSSRHKAWCENRYRSYNPKNNTFVAKGGVKKKCVSPYGP